MTEERETLSPYRWVIEVLLFMTLCAQAVTWLAPAPILGPIIKNLGISLGDAGLIISIIALCIAIFSLIGALVAARLGALRALLLGIWFMSIGGILSGYASSFAALLACRVLEGIGFGVLIAPPGTLVMQWFGVREWPYVNMANALCSYVGLTAVYSVTAPIYIAVGHSWQRVLLYYGLATAAVAVAWTVLGREHRAPAAAAGAEPERATIAEMMKMRDVVLMAVGLFGGMWVFQLYTAFLPEYFHTVRHLSLTESSAMTAVLPLTGIFAAAGGGLGTGVMGLRKPFTWPLAIVSLVGCAGAIAIDDPTWIRISLVLFGIGAAGGLSALITLLMELPGMTPAKMGTGLAFVWAAGYAGAFISPFLGGAVAGAIGLRAVMLGFLAFQSLPICAMYVLPETGPGRARYEVAGAGIAGVETTAVESDRGAAAS